MSINCSFNSLPPFCAIPTSKYNEDMEKVYANLPGRKRRWTDEDLKDAVANSFYMRDVCRKLKLCPTTYLKIHIKRLNLDTSHFKVWKPPPRNNREWKKIPLEKILVEDSTFASSTLLKNRLVQEELLLNMCKKCRQKPLWNNKPLTLQLHHINGIRDDNRLENLMILCPNCHSQTENDRGKSRKKIS